jgi:hypothetical protein
MRSRPHPSWSDPDIGLDEELDFLPAPERFSPPTAGALSGVLGGVLVVVALRMCDPALILFVTERALPQLDADLAQAIAAATLLASSAILGAVFAMVTRRLHRFSHAAIWSVLFFGSLWILAGAFIAKRAAHLAALLPFGPLLGVTAAYALALALHVPLRGGRSR